jgi:inosine-uridine nucleoside N-ribohydrolase
MLRFLSLVLLLSFALGSQSRSSAEPVRLILDTDIGNDIDDTLALAMIHALQNRAEVHLLAVTITKDNRYCAPFVDLVNTFYGRPDIPIGVVHNGKTPDDSPMIELPAQRRDAAGHYVYPHRIESGAQAQDAVQLLMRVLNEQPDHSVTIAQIGFSTNLARLLQAPGGRDLVERKVKVLCLMAGNFTRPEPEYNVYTDPASAKLLFEQWPTATIFSGFEIGEAVVFPYESIQKDFQYAGNHPIPEAYNIFLPKHENRPAWDPTAVLEAVRPDRGYFDLSPPGHVKLGPKNTTTFVTDPQGNCRYLIVKPEQAIRVREVLTALVSEPPQHTDVSGPARRMAF